MSEEQNIDNKETWQEDPGALHPPSENKPMEVHHHPHVEKKRFKEYLLEGLMIFIAVTLGFFAESFRENIVNREKERHYIETMVADLNIDTAALSECYTKQAFLLKKMENVLQIPVDELRDTAKQRLFYKNFVYFYTWLSYFTPNDNTFTQLKEAGGFSVIHKTNVIDAIGALYSYYGSSIKANSEWYVKMFEKLNDIATQVIRLPAPSAYMKDSAVEIVPGNAAVLIKYDKPLIERLYSLIRYQKGTLFFLMGDENRYRKRVTQLIQFLNEEYKLEKK